MGAAERGWGYTPTVSEIAEDYLISRRGQMKRSTCSTYTTIIIKHLEPEFGQTPIDRVKLEEISDFLYKKSFPEQGEALSASTLRGIITVLRAIFQHAESCGYTVAGWKSITWPTKSTSPTQVLTEEEQKTLREHLCSDVTCEKLGILTCMYTGLRIGEICAMKWGDISFETGIMTVKRTVQRIKNPEYRDGSGESRTKVIFDVPKSRNSVRCIPIPSFLLALMEEHRRPDNCFLLSGREDAYMEPRLLQNHYRTIMRNAGVEYVNFHALRHTFATNCVNLGFDVKTLSEILGHSDVSITLNTYVHPSMDVMKSFMERLK